MVWVAARHSTGKGCLFEWQSARHHQMLLLLPWPYFLGGIWGGKKKKRLVQRTNRHVHGDPLGLIVPRRGREEGADGKRGEGKGRQR